MVLAISVTGGVYKSNTTVATNQDQGFCRSDRKFELSLNDVPNGSEPFGTSQPSVPNGSEPFGTVHKNDRNIVRKQ